MDRIDFKYPQAIPSHEEVREPFALHGIPTAPGGGCVFQMRYGSTPGTALSEASTTTSDGKIVLKSSATSGFAGGGVQMEGALMWRPDRKDLEQHWVLRLGTNLASVVFIGLTDQNSALEMPMDVDGSAVVTANATNAVGFLYRNTQMPNWTLHSVRSGVVSATPRDLGVAVSGTTSVHLGFRMTATNGSAKAYLNGERVGAAINAALLQNTSLCPVVAFYPIGAGVREVHLDYYMGRQRKFVIA
jgi:hypothetical protein